MATEPIILTVRKGHQIVTPVRFARVGQGELTPEEPDPDDRGFAMGTRPFGWGTTDARGAMVGITEGQTVRLAVLREDIGENAPLFITTEPKNLVELVSPAFGEALGKIPTPVGQPHDAFTIRGLKDVAFRCGKIQVRLGNVEGPILGEMECHIFQKKVIRVVAWLVTIRGIGPDLGLPPGTSRERLEEELEKDFSEVNKVFRPTGIEIKFQRKRTGSFTIDRVKKSGKEFKRPGKVTAKIGDGFAEFSAVLNEQFKRDALNVYFVHRGNFSGLTFNVETPRPTGFGCAITDSYKKKFRFPFHVLAHELSHVLTTDHPDQNIKGEPVRGDMWTQRCLMFSDTFQHRNPPQHRDLGYGVGSRGFPVEGQLITLKDLQLDETAGQGSHCAQMRSGARLVAAQIQES